MRCRRGKTGQAGAARARKAPGRVLGNPAPSPGLWGLTAADGPCTSPVGRCGAFCRARWPDTGGSRRVDSRAVQPGHRLGHSTSDHGHTRCRRPLAPGSGRRKTAAGLLPTEQSLVASLSNSIPANPQPRGPRRPVPRARDDDAESPRGFLPPTARIPRFSTAAHNPTTDKECW